MIEKYVSCSEDMRSELKKLDRAFAELKSEKAELEKEVEKSKESIQKRLEIAQKLNDYEDLKQVVEAIPPEILRAYSTLKVTEKETAR